MNMLKKLGISVLAASFAVACSQSDTTGTKDTSAAAAPEGPPVARVEVVTDTYHGVTVEDPYRWLEDGSSKEVQEWVRAQTAYAHAYLDTLPGYETVHTRIDDLIRGGEAVSYFSVTPGADALYALKSDPALQQPVLVVLPASAETSGERVVVNPNAIDESGGTSIDWFRISPDEKTVAVSLSKGGSESGDVHLFDLSTGEETGTVTPRVNGGTAGGDLAWAPDSQGFFYTRYPAPGERPEEDLSFYQQVYFHALGTAPDADTMVLGNDLPRIAEIALFMDNDSGRLLITVQDGDSNRFAHYLRQSDGAITKFSTFGDGLVQVAFGPNDALYGISKTKSPMGEIVRLSAAGPVFDPTDIAVAAGQDALNQSFTTRPASSLVVTDAAIHAVYPTGGPSELRVFDFDGNALSGPDQAPVSAVSGLTKTPAGEVIFAVSSYVTPPEWFAFDLESGETRKLAISSPSTVDYSDVEVRREFATSKDGTKVPVNILLPKGAAKDGTNAILVTGYGGYGISLIPGMSRSRHILFENGVVFAQANLRGGGEYGEEWHKEGMLTNKQNVFDDFIAVIEYLVREGYAAPDRVGIVGGSNGGLLMGAVLTQRPDLMKAVVSHVGIYDMLRVELDPNGTFNIPEFGTVKDEAQFKALYAYSPYHHVKKGVSYPAILLPTGANDPRVNPMHSRKFAARLQAAQAGDAPILLRAEEGSGHGIGSSTDQIVALYTDQYAFLLHHLGVKVE